MNNNLNLDKKIFLKNIFGNFLDVKQQAYLLRTDNRDLVYNFFLEEVKINFEDHKEFFYLNLQVFDIDKARELIEYLKYNYLSLHCVIISLYSINESAQNALLKSLEDIPQNIKIILIVNFETKFLNTILSRLYILDNIILNNAESDKLNFAKITKKFLDTKPLSRMNLKEIKDLLEMKDEYALNNENKERVNREILEKLFLEIYKVLYIKLEGELTKEKGENKIFLEYLDDILEAIKYVKLNSSSPKTILEYLSLKLPILN